MAKTTNGSLIEYYYLVKSVAVIIDPDLFHCFLFLCSSVSCIFASPFYHYYGIQSPSDHNHQCGLLIDEHLQKYFGIYTVTLYYFIPLTIIIISYTSLLYFVYSKEHKVQTNTVMI